MTEAAIEFQQVTKRYSDGVQSLDVLRGANLSVAAGEFTAIIGPSGSGKSTLLHVAGGLDRHYGGTVRVAGRSLAELSDTALSSFRAQTVGFVFQAFNLLPGFSALENVRLPDFFSDEAPDSRERAQQALEKVGLGAKSHRRPGELSGGERQRVAVARALYAKPSILLADEPTGNLDARTGAQIIELFQELNRDHGMTLMIVTHEERVSKVAHRVVRLLDGQLVQEGA